MVDSSGKAPGEAPKAASRRLLHYACPKQVVHVQYAYGTLVLDHEQHGHRGRRVAHQGQGLYLSQAYNRPRCKDQPERLRPRFVGQVYYAEVASSVRIYSIFFCGERARCAMVACALSFSIIVETFSRSCSMVPKLRIEPLGTPNRPTARDSSMVLAIRSFRSIFSASSREIPAILGASSNLLERRRSSGLESIDAIS